MGLQQIGFGIRDDLRNNITDPINRKKEGGGEWIHYDRLKNPSKTPQIYINKAPSGRQQDTTGGGKIHFYNYLVQIVFKDGDRGISPSGDSNVIITDDDELRDATAECIIDRLETARIAISGAEVFNFVSHDGDFNLTDDKIVTTLRYEAQKK